MKNDSTLDWNLACRSGGKDAAPLAAVSTLLVSVLVHSGVFTNWRIIDGTSGNAVIFHLNMDDVMFKKERKPHGQVEARTLE